MALLAISAIARRVVVAAASIIFGRPALPVGHFVLVPISSPLGVIFTLHSPLTPYPLSLQVVIPPRHAAQLGAYLPLRHLVGVCVPVPFRVVLPRRPLPGGGAAGSEAAADSCVCVMCVMCFWMH